MQMGIEIEAENTDGNGNIDANIDLKENNELNANRREPKISTSIQKIIKFKL